MMTLDQLARARDGDHEAFRELVAPFLPELHAHCYRMLASSQDAEDAMQETLLSAWRSLDTYGQRASLRTWLYRIATNRCLNTLRSASRRPIMDAPDFIDPAARTPRNEVIWLEPFPDVLIDDLPDTRPEPAARYETKEAMSLAFVTALQLLPPRQRAVLVLRDVLAFSAREAAEMLDTTAESITSALKRARATIDAHLPDHGAAATSTAVERALVQSLTDAYAAGDVDALLALLTDEVRMAMPPLPFEYAGRHVAAQVYARLLAPGAAYRLIETRANGQPAFGVYVRDRHADVLHASGLLVITLAAAQISALTHFDASHLGRFGLPRTLPV